MEFTNCK